MKTGDLVKIFAASKQPLGVVVAFADQPQHAVKVALVFWNGGLHWIGQSKLEVVNESR